MKKVLLTMMMLLFAVTGVMRADELTVHDGTATNDYVPVYGYYADAYLKSEMVFPAAELADMNGAAINSLKFYASQTSVDWGSANFEVFLTEVTDASISAFVGDGTIVYQGALSIVGGVMTVEFTTPYTYNGGNLLVGVYNLATGSYVKSTWYGETVTGASVQGYHYSSLTSISPTQRNFLPKTTFDYTPAATGGSISEIIDFEEGSLPDGWTVEGPGSWTVGTGDYSSSTGAHGGTYNAKCTHSTSNNMTYLVSPAMDFSTAVDGAVNCWFINRSWAGDIDAFGVYYRVDGGAWNELYYTTSAHSTWTEMGMVDLTGFGANYQLGFLMKDSYGYGVGLDDIEINVTLAGAPVLDPGFYPTEIVMGDRPIGAWMPPFKVELSYIGDEPVEVNGLDVQNAFFSANGELPFTLNGNGTPVEIEMSTGDGEEGEQLGQLVVLYTGGDRNAALIPVSANAYTPVNGDVFEQAINVTSFPYNNNAPAGLYHNYNIPECDPDGKDAVYQVTFANDVLFSATTTGANGVAYLYTEDFNGEEGPMEDNYYEYNGPEVGPSPISMWYYYNYTGSNTFFGTSAGGGMIFGYKIPAATLQEYGLGTCAITTIEAAAREGSYYDIVIMKGGDTPDLDNMVYYQEFEDYDPYYFFDVNLDEPQFLGDDENLWIMFYSDSPYAAYCGRYPSDTENGKIWYTTNLSTWYSNVNYTPMIYTRFLELPTGREVTMNLADLSIREGKFMEAQVDEVEAKVFGDAKAMTNVKKSVNRNNRNFTEMYVPAGTYYAVFSSTDDEFPVSMTTAEVPAPVQAIVNYPYNGETGVDFPYLAEWILGDYTTEMQVLCGTNYPLTDANAIIDWTSDLVEACFLPDLDHNKTYFFQVNERNASGTTMGELIGFTTVIDPVEGFTAEETELYPGDAAVFTWEANVRSLRGYNLYQDGVLVNEQPITGTTYSVEDLAYNMYGYAFQLTAVYDEGESAPTAPVYVYMTGNGTVNGHVWEVDSITPVYNVAIQFRGIDEYGHEQIIDVEEHTNPSGYYEGEVLAGTFNAYGIKAAYTDSPSEEFTIAFGENIDDVDIIMVEDPAPLGMIKATEEENDVLVEWSWDPAELIVDFETGDFSQAEFTLPASYPWAITTTNPHEGTYCMKSTCEGVANGTSSIEATVEVPYDGKMGFFVKVSSESNYDKFHFYIDGVEQGAALSGQGNWVQKEFSVTEGTHTYKWEYAKDGSVNSNDDCVYVDDITMYRLDTPVVGGMTYDFEDNSMQGWTVIDGGNPTGYAWQLGSSVMGAGYGNNASNDCVLSKSYDNSYGVIYPDNYLVSPSKISAHNGAAISFYACAQDASYAAEHFGVAVSTASNTSAADFTTIQEWTMTAKGAQGSTAENEHDIRGTRAQGNWYQYTVDLSSYAGQQIWVAIRHFNCSDQFYLVVDDITLADGSRNIEPNRTLQGYNLYRRNLYGEGDTTLIATPAIDVYSYIDNEWPSLPFGIYSWGIQAKYEGNHHYPESRAAQVIDFETGDFSQYDFDNTSSYPWTVVSDNGSYVMKSGNSGVASSISAISATVTYTEDGTVSFDALCQGEGSSTFWDHCDFAIDGTVMHTSGANVSGWNNYSYAVTAGEHTFTWSYTKDSSVNPTGDKMEVDNITFDGVAGGTAAGGSGLSEILWSNEIEKDMEAEVAFVVTLNSNQSPVGTTVEMVGAEETYEGTLESDTLVFEAVRKGTYDVTVELEGYETAASTIEITEDGVYEVFLEEILAEVDNLYVSPTGWAMWNTTTATTGTTAGSGSSINGGGNGPTPPPTGNNSFTEDFEGGLNGWTVLTLNSGEGEWLHSDDNPGGYDYTTHAHGGTGFAMCYSFVDYVGAFNTDSYLITPQKYDIVAGSTLNFWADNANDSYPESFSVCVATADAPSAASDFTQVWSGSAKGISAKADNRHIANRYDNWRSHSIDLSAYAGQSIYIAFHDVNYDAYEVWIDDVELTAGRGDRAAVRYKVELNGVYEGETENMYWQHNVDGIAEGDTLVTRVLPIYATGQGEWSEYTWVYQDCSNFAGSTNVTATENEPGTAVELTWTMPEGGVTPPSGTPAEWYYYDNGNNEDAIGTGGGNFWWGVMFPAGTYEGTKVFKVAAYDYMAMTGTVTIYNDGTTAPATAVGTANVTLTGSEDFVEVVFTEPVNIDPDKNLWVVYYNGSNATYPAAVSANTGDANGRWVSLDGTTWEDLASYGLNYTFMVRAFVGDVERGEIHEITVPQQTGSTGTLSNAGVAKPGNRDMWDVLATFDATSGYQYGVATDGTNIYTSSWSSSSTSMFYKYDMEGNFIEEFNITGSGQIRDLTYDGEYFYGVANANTVYCLDLANHTLVSTFTTTYGAMRGCTYDSERDGFWVIGNWSGNLTLIDRTGAIQTTGPAPTSASGLAYYKDPDGVEHVYCLNNGTNDVQDYNIATNTITASVYNLNSVPGATGSTGGAHVGVYDGKTCLFADIQQSPQLIAIIELDAETIPVPPVQTGDILGSVIVRDGEIIAVITDPTVTSYVDETMEIGEHEYCVRVIHGGEPDVTYYAMSCGGCTTVNYTSVAENDVVDNIYPNPTHGMVTIEAQGMNHITVVNTLGQVVYDADVNADMMQLNLGQYKAGLYLIRVNTENGVSVKRVTVVK